MLDLLFFFDTSFPLSVACICLLWLAFCSIHCLRSLLIRLLLVRPLCVACVLADLCACFLRLRSAEYYHRADLRFVQCVQLMGVILFLWCGLRRFGLCYLSLSFLFDRCSFCSLHSDVTLFCFLAGLHSCFSAVVIHL